MRISSAKTWGSYLAIASLLLQVVTGILFAPMLASATEARLAVSVEGQTRTLFICTGNGIEKVTLDADGNPVDGKSAPAHCPICMAMGSGILAIPAPGIFSLPEKTPAALYVPVSQDTRLQLYFAPIRNRSPPLKI